MHFAGDATPTVNSATAVRVIRPRPFVSLERTRSRPFAPLGRTRAVQRCPAKRSAGATTWMVNSAMGHALIAHGQYTSNRHPVAADRQQEARGRSGRAFVR